MLLLRKSRNTKQEHLHENLRGINIHPAFPISLSCRLNIEARQSLKKIIFIHLSACPYSVIFLIALKSKFFVKLFNILSDDWIVT